MNTLFQKYLSLTATWPKVATKRQLMIRPTMNFNLSTENVNELKHTQKISSKLCLDWPSLLKYTVGRGTWVMSFSTCAIKLLTNVMYCIFKFSCPLLPYFLVSLSCHESRVKRVYEWNHSCLVCEILESISNWLPWLVMQIHNSFRYL